jgi:hypothetical protein
MTSEVEDRTDRAVRAYQAVVTTWSAEPGVSVGRALGNNVLKAGGRIFAFRKSDRLVIKVPAARAAELVAAGLATPFQTGRSPMREWVALALPEDTAADDARWLEYAAEAHAFVTSLPAAKPRTSRG